MYVWGWICIKTFKSIRNYNQDNEVYKIAKKAFETSYGYPSPLKPLNP